MVTQSSTYSSFCGHTNTISFGSLITTTNHHLHFLAGHQSTYHHFLCWTKHDLHFPWHTDHYHHWTGWGEHKSSPIQGLEFKTLFHISGDLLGEVEAQIFTHTRTGILDFILHFWRPFWGGVGRKGSCINFLIYFLLLNILAAYRFFLMEIS